MKEAIQPDSKIPCQFCGKTMTIEFIDFRIADILDGHFDEGVELRRAKLTCDACGGQYFVIQNDSEMDPKPPRVGYQHPQRKERWRKQNGLA